MYLPFRKFNRIYITSYGTVSGFCFGVGFSVPMSIAAIYFGSQGAFNLPELLSSKIIAVNTLSDGLVFGAAGWFFSQKITKEVGTFLISILLVFVAFIGSLFTALLLQYWQSENITWDSLLNLVFGINYFSNSSLFLDQIPSKEFLLVHTTFLPAVAIATAGMLTYSVWGINRIALCAATIFVHGKERTRGIVATTGLIWLALGSVLSIIRDHLK